MYEYVVDNRDLGFRLYEKGMKPFALRVFRGKRDYLGLLSGEIMSSWQSVAFKKSSMGMLCVMLTIARLPEMESFVRNGTCFCRRRGAMKFSCIMYRNLLVRR